MVSSFSLGLFLAPGCSLPVHDQSSLSWPLGHSVYSVTPSSGKQYVLAKVRSGRACSSLSEVSMEGRESRNIHWSPASSINVQQ